MSHKNVFNVISVNQIFLLDWLIIIYVSLLSLSMLCEKKKKQDCVMWFESDVTFNAIHRWHQKKKKGKRRIKIDDVSR